jgi:hypothetical protein
MRIRRFVLWAGAAVVLAFLVHRSNAQTGPDGDGAVLRLPGEDPSPRTAPQDPRQADTSNSATADLILSNLTIDPRYAMNRDMEPTPQIGPWMISIQSYVTKEAPEWARQMANELRGTYRLQAYVFTYGVEERRREYDRVKVMLDQQRKALKERGLELMYATRAQGAGEAPTAIISNDLPLAVAMRTLKVQHIPVQCAVLVGGYPNEDAAHRALLQIKKLPQPDPAKVNLDIKYYGADADPINQKYVKIKGGDGKAEYVNPFHKAFVCRNPSIKQDAAGAGSDAMDIKLLRKLNSDESYSLLNCKKPITLAVKQFQTFVAVQDREKSASILENFGFKTRAGEGVDQAAHDAHALAELLRKRTQLEAYVLHTKFTSVVSVGSYDSLEDPNLIAMRRELGNKLRQWPQMAFFPEPQPMMVPR